jgi:VIT1/CCC1 family predicted Fe2+/Mn2+ transporter
VRHGASNAFDYFVARDGRPILTCLTEAVQRSRMSGDAILVGSSVRHRNVVGSLVLFVFGALVGIVGYFFFPDLTLVPDHTSDKVEQHGLLVWPLGGMIAVVGMLGSIGALYPSFSEWMRSQKRALGVVLVAAIGFVVYWAWR